MKAALSLLRAEPGARVFFAAQTQSSFGTGAGYVAVLLIAYERFHSPWAITAVLLAEFLPGMLLGPFVGAAADRWSRKALMVGADVVRAVAFAGLALMGSIEATVAFALLAGIGNAAYDPTVMASLPSLVTKNRYPAATALYHAISEIGFTAGPALAALGFVFVGPEALLAANAGSFAVSAAALASLRFARRAPRAEGDDPGLVRGALRGVRAVASDRAVRSLLIASGATVVAMGMINVGELLLARESLGLGDSHFSMLVAAMGIGIAGGSLLGCSGATERLKRSFLHGMLLCAAGVVAAGLAPNFAAALAAFGAMGVGNGIVLTSEGVLLQTVVPDGLLGRLFGVKNALVSWCFGAAFVSAGAIATVLGPRGLFVLAGAGTLAAWAYGTVALRAAWSGATSPVDAPAPSPAAATASPAEAFFGVGAASLAGEKA